MRVRATSTIGFLVLASASLATFVGCGGGNSTNTQPPPSQVPSLTIGVSHTGDFLAGQQGATYTVTVANAGPGPTNGSTVTVTDTVPTAMTLVSMVGGGWTCASNSCTRSDLLSAGASYPSITTTVNVAANAASPETNQVSVSGGGSVAANGIDPTTITPLPTLLSVSMTHAGDFSAGQQSAAYTVIVSNVGSGPASGDVNVLDSLPIGEFGFGAQGTGWSCFVGNDSTGEGFTAEGCTRLNSDPLAPGQSYPPITFLVNVATNAQSRQVNTVQVTAGNSAPTTATDPTVIGGPNACASLPSGNESLMTGQYAAVAQGWQVLNGTPYAIAFSVALDGTGKIKDIGGGVGGDLDVNSASGQQHYSIISAGSFYTTGIDMHGIGGNLGCMRLETSGGAFTFAFTPGGLTSGVFTDGAVLQINDESDSQSFASGNLRIQDVTAFSSGDTSALHTNFAFGEHGAGPDGRFAIAGSFVLDPQTGTVSSFTADQNQAGAPSGVSGTGSLSSVSSLDGRAISNFTPQGSVSAARQSVFYVVNANEMFILGTDTLGVGNPIRTGQAIVSASSHSASDIQGNQMIHTRGQGVCTSNGVTGPCNTFELGLLSLNPSSSTSGTFTGTVFQADPQNGLQTTTYSSGNQGNFALTSSTGRVTLANAGDNPPVLYLASPAPNTDPVTFFIVGTDSSSSLGYGEQGATADIPGDVLNGVYFLSNDEVDIIEGGDGGSIAITSALQKYPEEVSFVNYGTFQFLTSWQDYGSPIVITNLDPNNNPAPGIGYGICYGCGTEISEIAITNGKRVYCLFLNGFGLVIASPQ